MGFKVAIQGIPGAFHEIGARYYYAGKDIEIIPRESFTQVVEYSKEGKDKRGIIAVENSIAGSLLNNYKLIYENNLVIVGEVFLRIRHNLMNISGDINDVEQVQSHYMAINQCREFLATMEDIHIEETQDTSWSAKNIAVNKLNSVAAIASELSAEKYGLKIIIKGIETDPENYTRFFIVKRPENGRVVPNFKKVSISFSLNHKVGSLHVVLAMLARFRANLTKIESVPIIGLKWQYMFFVDFIIEDIDSYKSILLELKKLTYGFHVLGEYKIGTYYDS